MSFKELYEQAKTSKVLRSLSPTFIEFKKKGDTVIGKLVAVTQVTSSKSQGFYNQYVVETDGGLVKFALGSATDREIEPLLEVGELYAFTFLSKESLGGGRSVNKFQIDCFSSHVDVETGEVSG